MSGIIESGGIRASRGWESVESGVHVEVEPFGSAKPSSRKRRGPKDELGCFAEGAFVEFDSPEDGLVDYRCGPRHSGIISVPIGELLLLEKLNPVFVKVRRHFWEFWRINVP
ncbi:MAG: hypothetical protein L0215_11755 [Gemmataceae bacterium]|nr:hypothetical protein [Gemmataceae bacterium]